MGTWVGNPKNDKKNLSSKEEEDEDKEKEKKKALAKSLGKMNMSKNVGGTI